MANDYSLLIMLPHFFLRHANLLSRWQSAIGLLVILSCLPQINTAEPAPTVTAETVAIDYNLPAPEIISIDYYLDEKSELNIEQVILDDSKINQPSENPTRLGQRTHPVWLKVVVQNKQSSTGEWLLDTHNFHAYPATIYQKKDSNFQTLYASNSTSFYSNLDTAYPHVAANITIAANTQTTLYIHYQSKASTHLHVEFLNHQILLKKQQSLLILTTVLRGKLTQR